jgi:hypothetical protein
MCLCRGRPHIFPETILEHTPFPAPPESDVKDESKLEIVGHPSKPEGGNPWLAIVQSAMYAKGEPRLSCKPKRQILNRSCTADSHVLKAIRSLLHYSTLYGQQPAASLVGAYKSGSSTEAIPGVSKLSGDIFQRGAGLVMLQTGWAREGQKSRSYDYSALGWDGAWE